MQDVVTQRLTNTVQQCGSRASTANLTLTQTQNNYQQSVCSFLSYDILPYSADSTEHVLYITRKLPLPPETLIAKKLKVFYLN